MTRSLPWSRWLAPSRAGPRRSLPRARLASAARCRGRWGEAREPGSSRAGAGIRRGRWGEACEPGSSRAGAIVRRGRWSEQDGTSPISAVFGVAIFLGFLLLATQVLVHLYTTSVVTGAAYDAARLVAGADEVTQAQAEAHAAEILGAYGARVAYSWDGTSDEQVVLRITGPTPARLLDAVGRLAGLDVIDREVRVRVEDLVEAAP